MSGKPCEVCGSRESVVLYRADPGLTLSPEDFTVTGSLFKKGEVSRCLGCGLVFGSSRIDPRQLYPATEDPLYEQESASRLAELLPPFQEGEKALGASGATVSVLDVGCASGILLSHLLSLGGYECMGIEPSRWAARAAAGKGVQVFEGFFEDYPAQGREFDMVTMFDCLEHAVSPSAFLGKAHSLMRTSGVLVLTTPDIKSWYHALLGRRYWFIEAMHLFLFSRATIRRLLEGAGFSVVKVRRHYKSLPAGYLCGRAAGVLPFAAGFLRRLGGSRLLRNARLTFYAGQMLVVARKR